MTDAHDLIVIGAGMAGAAAANKCASEGWRVAIVDELPYGGTCAMRGCDPKKILRRGAEIVDSARLMAGKGIDANDMYINWADLMQHKRGFTDPVPENMEAGLARSGVETLHGTARFETDKRLAIDDVTYESRHFLIATGARPRPLDFPGHEYLIDSTHFLELDNLPRRVLFVGGGFVSFEFAHIAARAGAQIVIVDRGARPLNAFDPDLVELLVKRGSEAGIDMRPKTTIADIEPARSGYRVTLDTAGNPAEIETDLVVHGAGRIPNLSKLALDEGKVAHSTGGVTVAAHLQSTTNSGRLCRRRLGWHFGMPLTGGGVRGQGRRVQHAQGNHDRPDYAGVPTAVFTIPELVRAGLLEDEATAAGIDVTSANDTSGWYSNYRIGETTAATKILVDTANDTIVGAHMLGPEYGELINFFSCHRGPPGS